jgi:hypothetical protein
MFLRPFAASAAALLIPAPVATANVQQEVISPSAIVQVICPETGGWSAGTAFRVGPGGIELSVNHVTKPGTCLIDGKPIKVSYASPDSDFSMIDGDAGKYLKIDCGGFVKGRQYVAVGYARGLSSLTAIELEATGETFDGYSVLVGMLTVIPGMSGGAVLDEETGKVVGTVNVYNFEQGWSGSVPLSETPVCKKSIA